MAVRAQRMKTTGRYCSDPNTAARIVYKGVIHMYIYEILGDICENIGTVEQKGLEN